MAEARWFVVHTYSGYENKVASNIATVYYKQTEAYKNAKLTVENPNGKVYSKKNEVLSYGFDEFKIFPNGWYMLTYKENKELYTRDNKLVASGFVDCEVLGNGFYAIKMDSIFYKHGNYNIYNGLSKLIAKEDNVVAFFGDKLMLKHSDKQDVYTLENYQKEEIAKNVTGYKKFYNGRFSLTFVNGSSAIYDENGNRLSTYTGPNATFLPDATFFACHQNIIERRYRPNGLMIKEEIFNCEQVSNYFLVTKEKSTELYDETGKIVDTDLLLACSFDNFALFQKKDRYHLYNQFGKVLEFNVY